MSLPFKTGSSPSFLSWDTRSFVISAHAHPRLHSRSKYETIYSPPIGCRFLLQAFAHVISLSLSLSPQANECLLSFKSQFRWQCLSSADTFLPPGQRYSLSCEHPYLTPTQHLSHPVETVRLSVSGTSPTWIWFLRGREPVLFLCPYYIAQYIW